MAAPPRIIPPGGTRGTVFRQVALVRLQDASVLLEQNRFSGAIYLAGYSLECLLKWAVTEKRDCLYLPADLETHDLSTLLIEAGLRPALMRKRELRTVFSGLAESWGPRLRYLAKAPV